MALRGFVLPPMRTGSGQVNLRANSAGLRGVEEKDAVFYSICRTDSYSLVQEKSLKRWRDERPELWRHDGRRVCQSAVLYDSA